MQSDNIIKLTVGAVLGVVLLFSLALPLLTDAASETRTFENEGYFKVGTTAEDFSFSWDYDNPTIYTINNTDLTFENTYNIDISVAMSDKFFIRSDRNGVSVYFNGDGTGNIVSNSTNKTLTVTREGGTITATNGDVTKTLSDSSTIYYMSETGDYVMKKSTEPVYMLADSLIFARGYSTLSGPTYTPVLLSGNIADGVTASAGNASVSISNVSVNSSVVAGYTGLYKLTDISMTGTVDGTSSPMLYNYFVVPASVTVEKTVHLDSSTAAMVNIIPIVLMAALLLGIVAYAVRARLS